MTSFQSTLGDEEGVAEELAENQRAISIAEFFEKNKHMLGFDSGARGLVTAVKEGVDNALDAAEEAGIHPDVLVEIEEAGDYYRVTIDDNGPGITKDQVPKIFGKLLYGSRFHSREQSLLPDQKVLVRRDGRVELAEIGTLCNAYLPTDEAARTGPIPDEVETPCFDRETGEVSWRPITHAIRHETDHETYRIETSRGRSIRVTGNHSLFGLDADGGITEVEAEALSEGDHVIAPERIPAPGDCETVNLLHWIPRSELEDRRWYVYGIDRSLIERIRNEGERVRKPASDGGRDRTYFQYDGVEVMKDSLEQNYLDDGFLPADVVIDLGWEPLIEDGTIRTYQVGGDESEVPVTVELTPEFMRFLGLYVAEGHADQRQIGFTFGSHEDDYVEEIQSTAGGMFAASTTVEERERNATRVKAFTSPLAVFMRSVCGDAACEKQVPPFVFRAPSRLQQSFIDALYDGDGSDAHPSNELSYATTSERLARELSYLWSMQGVVASWKERTNDSNISGGRTETYHVLVHGEDVDVSERYDADATKAARYRRLPASVVEDHAVDDCPSKTVPATTAGVLLAAGLGSELTYAKRFQRRIEYALDGEVPHDDYYRRTLESHDLLTADGRPTDYLRELWNVANNLSAFGDSDLCLLDVTGVDSVDSPEYVYDISVPGSGADENFVAGNRGALCVKNSRGQQGIGISAAVLYAQLTSGKPAKITSRTQGSDRAEYFELIVDTDENEPEIRGERTLSPGESSLRGTHGTRIELEMEANMRARNQLHDYVKTTAVVNPHARVELREPDEHLKFDRVEGAELPAETEEIRPHPHGVELGTVIKMLEATDSYSVSGFLQGEFTRVGAKTADNVIDEFRDRYDGRELAWSVPGDHEPADVATAVSDATANKSQTATETFATRVADALDELARVSHYQIVDRVGAAAEYVEDDHDTIFGETVRENAAEAAWRTVVGSGEEAEDRRRADLYTAVDDATTDRKDDATVDGLADRLAAKFSDADGHRDRVTRDTLRQYVDRAADMTEEREDATVGETAREKIVDELWTRSHTVPDDPPKVSDLAESRDAASNLVDAMRATDIIAPPTSCLSPITDELVEAGLRKEYDADFYAAATRDAEVSGGDPFIVEAGIAYGGELVDDGTVDVLRFANRVPLVYQRGACATTDVVKSIGWRNYGLDQPGGSGLPNGPAVLMVHVASTNVPFTSESKDAVANVPEIEDEIELAIREAARELKSYLNKRRSMEKRRKKQSVLREILPEMATKVSEVVDRDQPDVDDALARIMNNVYVTREVEKGDDTATVTLTVENNDSSGESPDVTEIVDAEPSGVNGDATVVEMDGEWFLKWSPEVAGEETERIEYETDGSASFDLNVEGVEDAKLTVDD